MRLALRSFAFSAVLLLSVIHFAGCNTGSQQTQNSATGNTQNAANDNAGPEQVVEQGQKHVTRPEPPAGTPPEFKAEALSCSSTGVNFSYHGGKLLQHAQIQVIFWGSQWSAPDRSTVTTKITKMVNSPYLTHIYPGVGCPTLLQFYWDSGVTPGPGSSVDDEVLRLIRSGSVIQPGANPDNIYLVLAPGSGYAGGFYGWHSWMRLTSGAYVHYGIADNYNLTQVLQTFSHELVEAMSDPRLDAYYGHDGGACGEDPCENADACYCFTNVQCDVAVTYYYGANDAACVAPDGPDGCQVGGTPHCKTCEELGAKCGQVDDGCGHVLQCGTCTPPNTCGGGGTPNVCGCIPSKENPCK